MNKPEVIVNLWAIHDEEESVIYGLAGRAYYAAGTDEEKTDLLKKLALTDFMLAIRLPVPDRFTVESDGETLKGYCKLKELFNPSTTLFYEMLKALESDLAYRHKMESRTDDVPEALKMPENPVFVITALVEGDDGSIRAIPGE